MIRFYKLINGEEIVATVSDDEGGDWCEHTELRKPFRHLVTNKGNMLMPYPCEVITIQTHHVLFSGDPSLDLLNAYNGQTGGIAVAPKGFQLPEMNGQF